MANFKPRLREKYDLAVYNLNTHTYVIGEFECIGMSRDGRFNFYCKERQYHTSINIPIFNDAILKYKELKTKLK